MGKEVITYFWQVQLHTIYVQILVISSITLQKPKDIQLETENVLFLLKNIERR